MREEIGFVRGVITSVVVHEVDDTARIEINLQDPVRIEVGTEIVLTFIREY
jgi:hypothetical protein